MKTENKTIFKDLSFGLIKTFLISSAFSLALTYIIFPDPNPFVLAFWTAFAVSLTLAALTVYLNLLLKIRESELYCALAFFLLPAVIITALIVSIGDLRHEWNIYAVFSLPFMLTRFYYFLDFRKIVFHLNIKISNAALFFAAGLLVLCVTFIYCVPNREWKSPFYQGYVYDQNALPVAGAKIRTDSKTYPQSTETDSSGYFRLYRNTKELSNLIFEKDGYESEIFPSVWHHFEAGTRYNFLKNPGTVTLKFKNN